MSCRVALIPHRSVSGHDSASLAFVEKGAEKFKGAALKPYRSVSGHAPANLAFVAVLTSIFALLAFSKY